MKLPENLLPTEFIERKIDPMQRCDASPSGMPKRHDHHGRFEQVQKFAGPTQLHDFATDAIVLNDKCAISCRRFVVSVIDTLDGLNQLFFLCLNWRSFAAKEVFPIITLHHGLSPFMNGLPPGTLPQRWSTGFGHTTPSYDEGQGSERRTMITRNEKNSYSFLFRGMCFNSL